MLAWIAVSIGVALMFLAVRDILITLMTATSRGSISRWFMAVAWRGSRPLVRRWRVFREIAGPLTFLSVISVWTAMIVLGWALIYWPFLPNEFLVDFGLELERESAGNFVTAIYFSMVVLATLGFGDIVPTGGVLRLLVPLEGLLGFGLLTASISWFLSIFPALSRRRRLVHQIALVRDAEADVEERWDAETAAALLGSFSTQLIDIRSDQIQFPVIYYFRDADPAANLAPSLRYLLDMADWARDQHGAAGTSMALRRHMLHRAVHDYLETVAAQFLDHDGGDSVTLLDALAEDRT